MDFYTSNPIQQLNGVIVLFERFTETSRQSVMYAQQEARELRQPYVGTEHILLGLILEKRGIAAKVLAYLEVDPDHVRDLILKIDEQEAERQNGQIPFTPRAKKTLELALRDALALAHNYIGTEHLLLSLTRHEEVATGSRRILVDEYKIEPVIIQDAIKTLLGGKSLGPVPTSIEGIQARLDKAIEKRNKETLHIRRLRTELRNAQKKASK